MKHQPYRKNNGRWGCGICKWEWDTRPNKDNCPGRLRIAQANDEYKTRNQWKKLGFEPVTDKHGLEVDFDAVSCIHSTDWHGYFHRDHVQPIAEHEK